MDLFVIQPEEVEAFLLPLPVGRLPGVGKVTEEKLAKLGIKTVGELRTLELSTLEHEFGRYGSALARTRPRYRRESSCSGSTDAVDFCRGHVRA